MSPSRETDETRPLLSDSASLESQPPKETKKVTPLPRLQLAALCAVRLVDPIAYSQIFPYINPMLSDLRVTDDPSKIGFFSGLVESTYAATQLLAIWQWSKLSDNIGRRPVIMAGTLGVVITTFLFGLSGSLFSVIFFRGLGGIFGGNIAVFHAALGELTDSSNQHIAYPIYGFIWPIGTIIGPLLGGLLSNLDTRYPAYFGFEIIKAHPYFAPGVVSACIAFLGLVFVYFFLDETLPSKRKRCGQETAPFHSGASRPPTFVELLAIPVIRALTLSGFALNFISTAFDVVFVLFCYTAVESGGLAFTATQIGYSLAISGIISCGMQILLLPILLRKMAATKLYNNCMVAWAITFMSLPLLNLLARCGPNESLWLWCGVVAVLFSSRLAWLAFSISMILVRRHTPNPTALGSTNGLVQFAMCVSRAISPTFISSAFALSIENQLVGGHLWVLIMTLFSLAGASLTWRLSAVPM
ncbi:major facilitator superfamily domain-containing protein [Mycena alexandri]|uniref:Major facilitator superfamily domain-containing protein n=1 Tax=Mycena alexandri TaxID=1745969 RepID=A0AAD6TG01_9AGAR|nr:major facilitator superfamily domain-containing protein [Mycena alexandri]